MLFSELYEIMVKKVTFVGFRRGDRPPAHAPLGAKVVRWRYVPQPGTSRLFVSVAHSRYNHCVFSERSISTITDLSNMFLLFDVIE